METKSNTFRLVLAAMMMCLIIVSILFIRVPIPFTQGYVHLGDAMIFLSVIVLGWKYGTAASALGGMLADLIGGFAAWAPWTFGIKGVMAIILGLLLSAVMKRESLTAGTLLRAKIAGMIAAGVFMVAAYYGAEGIMYGNWAAAILGIPWNAGQVIVGMIISLVLSEILGRTPAGRFFAYGVKPAGGADR